MNQPLLGGCLCGAVRFRYEGRLGGDLGTVTLCHCAQCRRVSGYGVAAAPAEAAALEITAGEALIRDFESSPGKLRAFCSLCGTGLYSRRTARPETLRLRIGALDAPPATLVIEAHIFARTLPPWAGENDAPRYPGLEPGRRT